MTQNEQDKQIREQLKNLTKSEQVTKVMGIVIKQNLIDLAYRGWFAKMFYRLDPIIVVKLAAEAKDGDNPRAYFCFKIKRAVAELKEQQ